MKAFHPLFRVSLPVLIATTPQLASAVVIFDSIGSVASKLCEVVDILFTGTLILTIVFVLLAAIKYITKGADPKAVAEAHQMLVWAAIGFAVAIMASIVPSLIASLLGTSTPYPTGC